VCVFYSKRKILYVKIILLYFKIKYFYIYVFFVISYTRLFSISVQYTNGFSKFLFHTYFY